jgi:hypothetical protein
MSSPVTLTFLGAAGTVTGSRFLVRQGTCSTLVGCGSTRAGGLCGAASVGRIRDELDWCAVVPELGEKVRLG